MTIVRDTLGSHSLQHLFLQDSTMTIVRHTFVAILAIAAVTVSAHQGLATVVVATDGSNSDLTSI